ncbi:hypothetical protein [Leptothoe kymatousa]|uniref:Autotransporter domain-containing protein n=1 Tax=Leptothoe kymatousa TAU-MAC 1615 TaxID=2364775 RepID=A0ABS5Y3T0_9CYAN|nr:hypothetical protein [Leptothoe kymatousa]MBT9312482.1 hypothetical protein [Leptothoe kymatousa TAU-MAC 1615]
MPKPLNPTLLGCLTLLAASYGAASIDPVYAAESLPDGEPQSDAGDLNNADVNQPLEDGAAISAHSATINPASDSEPAFVARTSAPSVAMPNNVVAPVTEPNNNSSDKLQRLLETSNRDASANSNLLAARNTAEAEIIPGATPTSIVIEPAGEPASQPASASSVDPTPLMAVPTDNAAVDTAISPAPETVAMWGEPAEAEGSGWLDDSAAVESAELEQNAAVDIAVVSAPGADTEQAFETSVLPQPAADAAYVADAFEADVVSEADMVSETDMVSEADIAFEADIAMETAQLPIEPPLPNRDVDPSIIDDLLEEGKGESSGYSSAPAITISNPSGFGADNRTAFVGAGYQSRTRFGNNDDGSMVFGVGLGDARENVGVQLSYTAASFGGSRDFGDGGFNAKIHRRLSEDWSVALGWEGFITTADVVDFEDSVYGSVSHIIRTRKKVTEPFSRVALTAGLGTGRFRSEDDVFADRDTVNVFGSMAVRVAEPVSAIVEWTGQDLAAGLSITPFKDVPIVLLPAVRDITGAGDGGRFVLGAGFSFKF